MKDSYEKMEMEILVFEGEDIIMTSPVGTEPNEGEVIGCPTYGA